jgi:hypothetical protein
MTVMPRLTLRSDRDPSSRPAGRTEQKVFAPWPSASSGAEYPVRPRASAFRDTGRGVVLHGTVVGPAWRGDRGGRTLMSHARAGPGQAPAAASFALLPGLGRLQHPVCLRLDRGACSVELFGDEVGDQLGVAGAQAAPARERERGKRGGGELGFEALEFGAAGGEREGEVLQAGVVPDQQ